MQYLLKDFTISRSRVKYGTFLTDDTENIIFLYHYLLASLFYIIYYYMFLWFSYLIDLIYLRDFSGFTSRVPGEERWNFH